MAALEAAAAVADAIVPNAGMPALDGVGGFDEVDGMKPAYSPTSPTLEGTTWSGSEDEVLPAPHELVAASEKLQGVLQKVVEGISSLPRKDHDPFSDLDQSAWSEKEKTLFGIYRSISDTDVDLKTKNGQTFYYELRKSTEDAKQYKNCKSKEEMAQFRKDFAAKKANQMIEVKTKTRSTFDLNQVDGEYCSFPRMVQREGGDVLAFTTAKSYIASALDMFKAGKTFNGHPWVKFDSMRKTTMVLHTRETLAVGQKNTWCLTASSESNAGSSGASSGTGATGATQASQASQGNSADKGAVKGGNGAPASGTPNTAAKDETGKKRGGAITAPETKKKAKGTEAPEASDDFKKRVSATISAFGALKKDYNSANQAATDLLSAISTDDAWMWLRENKLLLKPLRAALAEAEVRKKQNEVWVAWTLQNDFPKFCKSLDAEIVLAESKNINDFKLIITKISNQTSKLHNMHGVQCQDAE